MFSLLFLSLSLTVSLSLCLDFFLSIVRNEQQEEPPAKRRRTVRRRGGQEEQEMQEEPEEQEKQERQERQEEPEETQERQEGQASLAQQPDRFPTFITGFVQCICFRKLLYRKGFLDSQDMIFVHVPGYYNFDVAELRDMWMRRFVASKKFWLGSAQIVFFESELDMISEFLFYLFTHVDLFMGFNSMGFDLPFLITRCNYLKNNSQISIIHKPFFMSITTHCFTIPPNPKQLLYLRNTSTGFSSSFYIVCKSCRRVKRDTKLDISTANDENFVPCPECKQSQLIDKAELITQRASTRSRADSLVIVSLSLFLPETLRTHTHTLSLSSLRR